jgi:RHS repeat-associated protein
LNSTQAVSDINGSLVQSVFYAPFGEVIYEDNAYWHRGRIPDYTFNGKELDEENGMYYYSARYYNPPTFISRDPLFEKYPTISPYAYCSNNPINRVDPTGMEDDWYQNSQGHTFWRAGNAPSIEKDGETYNNIGERHSYKVGSNETHNYKQMELESIDYSTSAQFQAQSTGTGCKTAADAMVKTSGANPATGRGGEILMANHNANGVVTTPTANAASGIDRIELSIMNGNAITVGIDYKAMQQHNLSPKGDGMTDHFVAMVGMNVNIKTGNTTYRFFDPGSRSNGNSPTNTMSHQGGFLQGRTAFRYMGQQQPFKVTTVRQNR